MNSRLECTLGETLHISHEFSARGKSASKIKSEYSSFTLSRKRSSLVSLLPPDFCDEEVTVLLDRAVLDDALSDLDFLLSSDLKAH